MAWVWKVLAVLALMLPAGAYVVGNAVGPPAVPAPANITPSEEPAENDPVPESAASAPAPIEPRASVDGGTSAEADPVPQRDADARGKKRERPEEPGAEDDQADNASQEPTEDSEPDDVDKNDGVPVGTAGRSDGKGKPNADRDDADEVDTEYRGRGARASNKETTSTS